MPSPDILALRRSLRIYHGDKARNARMDALYARFLAPGDLAFDIGAHVGDRVSSFRRLGCRVIALEPQPLLVRALRLIHGRDPQVTILQAALAQLRQNSTTLVIAHRLSTIQSADKIIVVDKGRIVERGRHDTLLAYRGHYEKLVRMQFAPTDLPLQGPKPRDSALLS